MASHSSTFAWKIPWTEESGGLQSVGSLESDMTEATQQQQSCLGYDINWSETTRSKMAEDSTSSGP